MVWFPSRPAVAKPPQAAAGHTAADAAAAADASSVAAGTRTASVSTDVLVCGILFPPRRCLAE
jgi:hypothetical protein